MTTILSNRDGSNTAASSPQYVRDRCRFHVEIKMSVPRLTSTPPAIRLPPVGSTSSRKARLMRMGGSGYSRSDSVSAKRRRRIFVRSSMSGLQSTDSVSINV